MLNQFEIIIIGSSDFEDAFKKVSGIKDVPNETAKYFREKYDPDRELTPKQAFRKYYDEIKDRPFFSTHDSAINADMINFFESLYPNASPYEKIV